LDIRVRPFLDQPAIRFGGVSARGYDRVHRDFRAAESPDDRLRLKGLLLEQIDQRRIGDRFQVAFHLTVDDAPDRIAPRLTDEADAKPADGIHQWGLLRPGAAGATALATCTAATAPSRRNTRRRPG